MTDYAHLAVDYARYRQVHPGVLAALLAVGAGATVEVGSGTGNYALALTESGTRMLAAVDPAPAMLGQARARGLRPLVGGRAEALPLADGCADLVFSVDVIHHVRDRAAAYREAFRVLRPGGLCCTVTDSDDIIRARVPLSRYFPETVPLELARYPAVNDLKTLMTAAGLVNPREQVVQRAYDLTDAAPYRQRAFSSLHLLDFGTFERGLACLEADLQRGPVACVSRYLLLWGTRPDA